MNRTMRDAVHTLGVGLYANAVKYGATPQDAREALYKALLSEAEKLAGSFFSE